jgi:hypothetical protein
VQPRILKFYEQICLYLVITYAPKILARRIVGACKMLKVHYVSTPHIGKLSRL